MVLGSIRRWWKRWSSFMFHHKCDQCSQQNSIDFSHRLPGGVLGDTEIAFINKIYYRFDIQTVIFKDTDTWFPCVTCVLKSKPKQRVSHSKIICALQLQNAFSFCDVCSQVRSPLLWADICLALAARVRTRQSVMFGSCLDTRLKLQQIHF